MKAKARGECTVNTVKFTHRENETQRENEMKHKKKLNDDKYPLIRATVLSVFHVCGGYVCDVPVKRNSTDSVRLCSNPVYSVHTTHHGIDYSFLALKFSSGKIIVTKYVNAKLLLNEPKRGCSCSMSMQCLYRT